MGRILVSENTQVDENSISEANDRAKLAKRLADRLNSDNKRR